MCSHVGLSFKVMSLIAGPSLTAAAPHCQTRLAVGGIYRMLCGLARMLCRCAHGGIKHTARVLLHTSRLPAHCRLTGSRGVSAPAATPAAASAAAARPPHPPPHPSCAAPASSPCMSLNLRRTVLSSAAWIAESAAISECSRSNFGAAVFCLSTQ